MDIKQTVRERYGKLASGREHGSDGCCRQSSNDRIPSFGVGKPIAHAQLAVGERVLDIGSGAGRDCLEAAELVGDAGSVVGLDMTNEMLAAAEEYARQADLTNVRFVKGDAEKMPFAYDVFDVVISDCVINLVPDKRKVFLEIVRVLKPGGRIIISDVVTDRPFTDDIRSNADLWCSCISGALEENEYAKLIQEAGFGDLQTLERMDAGDTAGNKIIHITLKAYKPCVNNGCP